LELILCEDVEGNDYILTKSKVIRDLLPLNALKARGRQYSKIDSGADKASDN